MTPLSRIFALLLFLAASQSPVQAQEVQRPLDDSGDLTVVDAALASRLNLFQAYDNFREARLFEQPDGSFVLVIQYEREGSILQERKPLTEVEVADLRAGIAEAMYTAQVRPPLNQEGRVPLLRRAAFMSLLAYGPSLAVLLDANDDAAGASVILLTGAAGFFAPYYATRGLPVTPAASSLTTSGALLGYLHGVAIAGVIGGESTSAEAVAGVGLAASLGEAMLAYRFATTSDLGHGAAETIAAGSAFGAGIGLASAGLILGQDFDGDDDLIVRSIAGLGLVGSGIGALTGYGLARHEHFSRGDARVLSTVGLLGFQVGSAAVAALDIDAVRPTAATLIVGTGAGLTSGYLLARGRDFSASQGNYMALGAMSGGLAGAALAHMTDASPEVAATLSTLGALAGFGVLYASFADEAALPGARSLEMSVAPSLDPVDRSIRPAFNLRATL